MNIYDYPFLLFLFSNSNTKSILSQYLNEYSFDLVSFKSIGSQKESDMT